MVGTDCDQWATCEDLALLGWIALDRCVSCVGTAISKRDGRAPATGSHDASHARLVTGDELDALLSQARSERPDTSTC
jgi:hypothetical protein